MGGDTSAVKRNTIEIQWQIRENGKHQVWKAKGRAMDTKSNMGESQWRRPGAEFGGRKKISRTKISVFLEKMSIFMPKISDDFFLVIDQVFQILHFFTVLNVVYDTLFTSDNTTSLNIGGTNAWAVPSPQILGGTVPPVPPRSPPLAKAQDTRANPNSWETHLVRKRWDIGLLRALSLRIMMMMMIYKLY